MRNIILARNIIGAMIVGIVIMSIISITTVFAIVLFAEDDRYEEYEECYASYSEVDTEVKNSWNDRY